MMNKLLLFTIGLLLLAGCASPANYSSMPWARSGKHFVVEPVSPGLYQLDQFVITYEGLSQMLRHQIAIGQPSSIIIKTGMLDNVNEPIKLAQLAESLNLKVYTSDLTGFSETSSNDLIQQTVASEDTSEDVTDDEVEYLFNSEY